MNRMGLLILISISALAQGASAVRAQDPGTNWLADVFRAFGDAIHERDERFAAEAADRWRYYEYSVSFTAEGQDFEVSGIFSCEPYLSGYEFVQVRYRRQGDRLAIRLPSGSAFIFGAPNLCFDAYDWETSSEGYLIPTVDLHPGYVPLAIWLDNADDPMQAELYISEAYYEGRNPRLIIHNVNARGVAESQQSDFSDVTAGSVLGEHLQDLRGLYATVVSQEIWSQIPDIDRFLAGIVDFQNFSLEDSSRITSNTIYFWDRSRTRQTRLLGIPTAESQYHQNERVRAASRHVYPAEIVADGAFEVATTLPGLIVLSRDTPTPTEFDLRIGASTIPGQIHPYWQFHPESGLLLSIQMQTLSFL